MRELVIDEIDKICFDPRNDYRWGTMFINRGHGLVYFHSKKEKDNSGQMAVNLSFATRSDFEALNDEALLVLLTAMVRQGSKQM